MNLLLEHRWEHALVAAVIEAASKSNGGSYLGRTAMQKLMYFLQVLNVPMRFKFRIHHYGPFSDELADTLDWLQADDVIEDRSRETRYSNYAPGENWHEIKSRFQSDLGQYQEMIDAVAKAMGGMDPDQLELIATLDFCYRWVHARGGNGPWKELTIQKFKQIKGDKFTDSKISDSYDRLARVKLIQQ
ncbi:MAG: hypothetical protein KDA52_17820 [Planctomycetaceae bacterium]|nr:hypothetical protein [Planctomycetaceae bacterium]